MKDLPRRPAPWLRVVAALFLVLLAVQVVMRHDPLALVSGVLIGAMLIVLALAPRPLYDGRAEAWLRSHRLVRVGLTVVLATALLLLLLSFFVPGG